MADLQNKDVMHHIRGMLESLQKDDPQQSRIILNLLLEVVKEFNSGRTMNVDKKLYDMINGATFETKKK